MNVLVACEESQRVCKAFRARGHRAFSCDIIECSGGHPEWHIQGDVIPLLNGHCEFTLQNGQTDRQTDRWDLIIAHPPCTDLCVSGARWFAEKQKDFRQQKAVAFFMHFVLANCDRIAVENPIGIMSTVYRKPDQMIQPYEFGHPYAKKTCLWLKGLEPLKPTCVVEPERIHSGGKSGGYSGTLWYARDEEGRILSWNDPRTARERSKTFPGIAEAFADQWGGDIRDDEIDGITTWR